MIEVERKIFLNSELKAALEKLKPLSESQFVDTYYDLPTYFYTSKNVWLRKRDATFELKRAVKGKQNQIDRYEEIVDEKEICDALDISFETDLESSLKKANMNPFASLRTARKKYQIDSLTLDIDVASAEAFSYEVAEVEAVVESEEEVAGAESAIQAFLKNFALDSSKKPKAKLVAFLESCQPTHYLVLQNAGILA